MKVLIVNAHPDNQTGRSKFEQFHCRLKDVLKETLFYGNDHEEHIRRRQQLQDLLYEEDSDFIDQKNLDRFRLYTHVVVDGEANIRPWNPAMKDVLLLIRMCVRERTRFIGCGFGCLALYFTLATTSQQANSVGREETGTHVNPATGDLFQSGIKVGNCGLHNNRHAAENKTFTVKNHQLDKAVLLPTKMHYACMAGLAGSPVLRNTKFPFALYCTNTWMCNPSTYLKQHVDVLIETDCKLPIAFTKNNCIGIVNFNRELMNVLAGWIVTTNEVFVSKPLRRSGTAVEDLSLDNELKKPLRSRPTTAAISRTFTYASRPPSSSNFSKSMMRSQQIPVVRCSGPYQTQDEFYMKRLKESSSRALSRTYMRHDIKPDEYDIQNYVTRSYSRPTSNYQYRTIEKSKWVGKRPFLLA